MSGGLVFESSSLVLPSSAERTLSNHPLSEFKVPNDVERQFNVEFTRTGPVEEIISEKLNDALEHEEAFYIVDLGKIIQKYVDWIRALPRVKPFYAIKCNNDTAVIKTLGSLGVNFDCASKNEISQILDMGFEPSRIIYANPTKMKSHITFARNSGVEMMTFDNAVELKKIAEVHPTAKLVLRIITDDSNSLCKFSTKFGAPMESIKDLLEEAKKLNLNVIGVSFHVGSSCMNPQSFVAAIRSASNVFSIAKNIGFDFKLLDIGGGYPGVNTGDISFFDIASSIRPVLDELFPPEVQIISEPGRYFVCEAFTLVANVFAKRQVPVKSDSSEKQFLYYINEGVYQSFNCLFFDHVDLKPILLEPKGRSELFQCTLFGPTCDSLDCVAKGLMMPELEPGDWIFWKNMGAYTLASASSFNGFKSRPSAFYIQSPIV